MSAAPDPSARQVLEPCPFCGSAHVDVVMFETHHNEMWHRAECQNCMAKSSGSKYPALAIAAWNRRAGTATSLQKVQTTIGSTTGPAVAELVEALKAVTTDLSEFHSFCDDAKRPCGEYGVECPIAMGEWISNSERATLVHARALLAKHAAKQEKDHG